MNKINSKDEFLDRSNSSVENEEINFLPTFRTFKRKKFLISKITFLGTIAGLIYSFATPEIYRGVFEVVVESRKTNVDATNNIFLEYSLDRENRTQVYILQSNLILKPVYEKLKSNNLENKEYRLSPYEDWKEKLNIRFKEFSKILEVNMKDKNKNLIIDSLNEIAVQYQSFSKRDREKTLTKTLEYLEIQKNNLEKKTLISLKELNEFTIANGLGDIDGFVDLDNQKYNFDSLEINNKAYGNNKDLFNTAINAGSNKISQRYNSQFTLLENYETKFVDLSSKLKANSNTLKSLKTKIENLKESLKRPNEIIIKFKELTKKASRDEYLLENVNKSLELTKLEKIKKQDPWELISQPRIRSKVWPNKKLVVALAFIGSLISGLLIAIFKEKKENTIFEITEIKNNVDLKFFGTLYLEDLDLNLNLILNNLNIPKTNIEQFTLSFVFFEKNKSIDKKTINFLPPKIFKNYTNLLTNGSLNKYENIILIIENESLNYSDLQLLNDLISINRKNMKGWVFIHKN